MPAKVTLKVSKGDMAGKEFVFDERDSCLIGRSKDCRVRVPGKVDRTISRRHCLLDINPPDIRIRDYGSLNGTRINDNVIGKRQKGQTPDEGAKLAEENFSDHDLQDGDRLKLGKTLFEVAIVAPASCADCGAEIPEDNKKQAEVSAGVYQCASCQKKPTQVGPKARAKSPRKECTKCGRDVSDEVGQNRHGDYICASCQADPMQILKRLLDLAKSGRDDLQTIQGYTIEKELERGGMGLVCLARHDQSGERVALKVMLPQVATNERGKQLFLRETESSKALEHKHVVKLKDSGCSEGTFFFTMEFCNQGSVADLMQKRQRPLSISEAGPIILQTLDGLDYAHQAEIPVRLKDGSHATGHGLVHRDLKPQNIFLTGSGKSIVAKVGDFGLAKAFDKAGLSGMTRTETKAGTPVFMPRQQVMNFKYAEPDVDVWAAAACLYNMLTGRTPREFKKGRDPWQTILQTSPVPIRKRDPAVPKRLAEVIDTALRDNPNIGFQTASELKQALEDVL